MFSKRIVFNGLIIFFLLLVHGCLKPKIENNPAIIDKMDDSVPIELGMEMQKVIKILEEEGVEIEIVRTVGGYLGFINFDPSPTAFNPSDLVFDDHKRLVHANLIVNGKHICKGSISGPGE